MSGITVGNCYARSSGVGRQAQEEPGVGIEHEVGKARRFHTQSSLFRKFEAENTLVATLLST
jgi:hypothetical protein